MRQDTYRERTSWSDQVLGVLTFPPRGLCKARITSNKYNIDPLIIKCRADRRECLLEAVMQPWLELCRCDDLEASALAFLKCICLHFTPGRGWLQGSRNAYIVEGPLRKMSGYILSSFFCVSEFAHLPPARRGGEFIGLELQL